MASPAGKLYPYRTPCRLDAMQQMDGGPAKGIPPERRLGRHPRRASLSWKKKTKAESLDYAYPRAILARGSQACSARDDSLNVSRAIVARGSQTRSARYDNLIVSRAIVARGFPTRSARDDNLIGWCRMRRKTKGRSQFGYDRIRDLRSERALGYAYPRAVLARGTQTRSREGWPAGADTGSGSKETKTDPSAPLTHERFSLAVLSTLLRSG